MDRLEDQLRALLRQRAEEITPSPSLRVAVERRAAQLRRRRTVALAAAVAVAAAVVGAVAAVVVTLARPAPAPVIGPPPPERTPTPTPASTPEATPSSQELFTSSPPPAPAAPRPSVLVVDDAVVWWGPDGQRTLWCPPGCGSEDLEFGPVAVAVRPGSTGEDLTVAVLRAGEGMAEVGWLEVHADRVGPYTPLPAPYQPADSELTRVAGLAWAPDGGSLAWVETTPQGVTLRTVGWSDGPGTGRPADDNAAFTLTGVGPDDLLELVDWEWSDDREGVAHSGSLAVRVRRAAGAAEVHVLGIERQPDGALALIDRELGPATRVPRGSGGAVVALGWDADRAAWSLEQDGDTLRVTTPLGPEGAWEGSCATLSPGCDVWAVRFLVGYDRALLIGPSAGWLIAADGSTVELPAGTRGGDVGPW